MSSPEAMISFNNRADGTNKENIARLFVGNTIDWTVSYFGLSVFRSLLDEECCFLLIFCHSS